LEESVGVGDGAMEGERVGDEEGLIVLGTVGVDVGAGVGLTVGAGEGANVGVRFCAITGMKIINRSLEFSLVWVRIRISLVEEPFSIYDDEGDAPNKDRRLHDNNSDNH
jgi:hypothetical protein